MKPLESGKCTHSIKIFRKQRQISHQRSIKERTLTLCMTEAPKVRETKQMLQTRERETQKTFGDTRTSPSHHTQFLHPRSFSIYVLPRRFFLFESVFLRGPFCVNFSSYGSSVPPIFHAVFFINLFFCAESFNVIFLYRTFLCKLFSMQGHSMSTSIMQDLSVFSILSLDALNCSLSTHLPCPLLSSKNLYRPKQVNLHYMELDEVQCHMRFFI